MNKETEPKKPEPKKRLSIGSLSKMPKTKPKSPDMRGKICIQRNDIEALVSSLKASGRNEVECPIAAWHQKDTQGTTFLTVTLSPCVPQIHFPTADDAATD